MENQVSIIINGVRYDAVEKGNSYCCEGCDLLDICDKYEPISEYLCLDVLGEEKIFKKSTNHLNHERK